MKSALINIIISFPQEHINQVCFVLSEIAYHSPNELINTSADQLKSLLRKSDAFKLDMLIKSIVSSDNKSEILETIDSVLYLINKPKDPKIVSNAMIMLNKFKLSMGNEFSTQTHISDKTPKTYNLLPEFSEGDTISVFIRDSGHVGFLSHVITRNQTKGVVIKKYLMSGEIIFTVRTLVDGLSAEITFRSNNPSILKIILHKPNIENHKNESTPERRLVTKLAERRK